MSLLCNNGTLFTICNLFYIQRDGERSTKEAANGNRL